MVAPVEIDVQALKDEQFRLVPLDKIRQEIVDTQKREKFRDFNALRPGMDLKFVHKPDAVPEAAAALVTYEKNGKQRRTLVRLAEPPKLDQDGKPDRDVAKDLGFSQMCNRLKVPAEYAARLFQNDPAFFTDVMNQACRHTDQTLLVRTHQYDEKLPPMLRSSLRNTWRRFDATDLIDLFMTELKRLKLPMKAVDPKLLNMFAQVHGQNLRNLRADKQSLDPDNFVLAVMLAKDTFKGYAPTLHGSISQVGGMPVRLTSALARTACTNSFLQSSDHSLQISGYSSRFDNKDWMTGSVNELYKLSSDTFRKDVKRILKFRRSHIQFPEGDEALECQNEIAGRINRGVKATVGPDVVNLMLTRQDLTLHGLSQAMTRYANSTPPQIGERLRSVAMSPAKFVPNELLRIVKDN